MDSNPDFFRQPFQFRNIGFRDPGLFVSVDLSECVWLEGIKNGDPILWNGPVRPADQGLQRRVRVAISIRPMPDGRVSMDVEKRCSLYKIMESRVSEGTVITC